MSKKSSLRVGINGLGRIGRLVFRQGFDSLNIVAVNGRSSIEMFSHLLQHDSVHSSWNKSIKVKSSKLIIDNQEIIYSQKDSPDLVGWDQYGVDVVIECSGQFKKSSNWEKSFSKGVKKVIVSAPAKDPDLTLVYGVNEHLYKTDKHRFISNASCTTNCLAPMIKVLQKFCGIERGFFSTIHSYTSDQKLLDSSHNTDFRRARAAGLNIIPTNTGAGSAISLIFPELKNRIDGLAFRVPTANVSLVDLIVETKKEVSLSKVQQAFEQACFKEMKGVLAIEEKPLVSSDFIGRRESSILDFSLSRLQDKRLLKLVSWYDNEAGFSQRMIDFIHFMGSA